MAIWFTVVLFSTACIIFPLFLHYFSRRSSVLPTNWPILGMLPGVLPNLHCLHNFISDILRETGGTFLFRGPWLSGFNYLITADLADTNHVYNHNFPNYPKGDGFSELFNNMGGLVTADGESWKAQRQQAHAVVSHPRFRSFVLCSSTNKVDNGLIPLLTLISEQEDVIDLQDVMMRLTYDLTSQMMLGVDAGSLAAGLPASPFAKAIDHSMEAIFSRHVVPSVWWKLMRFLNVGQEKKLARSWKVMHNMVSQILSERRKTRSNCPDLLTSYMNGDSGEDDNFLRDTCLTTMLAGRDTVGAALTWFFWLLAQNLDVEKRLIEELKDNSFSCVSSVELGKLIYLHAALCESLRLYPPVPLEKKCALRHEILPSGAVVRPGMEILLPVYAMGRMEGVWGKDCMEFKPERWISEEWKLRHEPSYKFLAFNSGPRTCLGRDIALTQMKAVAAAVVYNFHVEVVKGHVVEPELSIILHMKNGLMVRLKKRSNGRLSN